MVKWKYKNFYSSPAPVSGQLVEFLNMKSIEDFKVVQMKDDYIEIVYKEKSNA